MKVVAWMDRRTARDLYDLVGLARLGALDTTTAELVRHTSGLSVQPHFFTKAPSDWTGQLAHQTGRLIPAQEALRVVRMAFGETLDWEGDGVS